MSRNVSGIEEISHNIPIIVNLREKFVLIVFRKYKSVLLVYLFDAWNLVDPLNLVNCINKKCEQKRFLEFIQKILGKLLVDYFGLLMEFPGLFDIGVV